MRKTLRNIALFLFGVFSFPLIYQPLHVTVHHGHTHCSRCSAGCSAGYSERDFVVFKSGENKEAPCPICNYHFSLNEIPAEFLSLHIIVIETDQVFSVPLQGYSKNTWSELIPRAPPVC